MIEGNDTIQQQSDYRRMEQPHQEQQVPARARTALMDGLLIAMRQLQQVPTPAPNIVR